MKGTDLREWRYQNRHTQESLAAALGVTRQTIVGWERSERDLARMLELALTALVVLDHGKIISTGEATEGLLEVPTQRTATRQGGVYFPRSKGATAN